MKVAFYLQCKIYKEFCSGFSQTTGQTRAANMNFSKIVNVFAVLFAIVVSTMAAVYPDENVAEASELRAKRDHHQGVTGPVHTYVKTDKHANFKWGVKHHVGHHYAGRR